MLLEQAELRSPKREEAYTSCGLLDRIRRLNICRDSRQLEKLMKGLFGGSDEGNLGLRDFLSPGMSLPADPFPCKQNNLILVVALKNLELVLRVVFASAFENSIAEFIKCLEGESRPLELVPSGFLLHAVETLLTQYFRRLRDPYTRSTTDRDLGSPTACASALQSKFKLLGEELSDSGSLSMAVARFTLRKGNQPTCWPTNPVSQEAVPARPHPSAPILVNSVCPFFFASQLKVDDIKTGHRPVAADPTACAHTQEGTWSIKTGNADNSEYLPTFHKGEMHTPDQREKERVRNAHPSICPRLHLEVRIPYVKTEYELHTGLCASTCTRTEVQGISERDERSRIRSPEERLRTAIV